VSAETHGQSGSGYRKRRLRRALAEMVGNHKYSRPALNGLDTKLEPILTAAINNRPGFFIEAGANDGFEQSNTYYLARKKRWRGLLIEPLPDLAEHCERIRPESRVVRCALGPHEAQGTSVTIHRAGLMSTVEGALGDTSRQQDHLQRAKGLQPGAITGDIEVPVRSLSSIIDEHAPDQPIDLLSLDVEGYEPQALAGLDLDRHAPRFICIEANDPEAIDAMLREHYDLIDELSHHDRLYRLRDDQG
jgi:FkbM family methyltransferase